MKFITLFFSLFFLTNSCIDSGSSKEPQFPQFNFIFSSKMKKINEGDELHSTIKTVLGYYEITDEESDCNGKLYAPEVIFLREDLSEKVSLGFALDFQSKTQKKFGMLSRVNLKSGYDVSILETPKLMVKKANKPVERGVYNNSINLNLNNNKSETVELRKQVENLLCTGVSEINFIIENGIITGPKPPLPPVEDPCFQNTVADALDLKDDLTNIVNTSLSYSDRDRIARETWDTYFDPMASVTMYLDLNEKHPDFWESGDGKNYLVDRLAFKNSITDINIIRLEYHKKTKKITAMVTVECHDASQIQ